MSTARSGNKVGRPIETCVLEASTACLPTADKHFFTRSLIDTSQQQSAMPRFQTLPEALQHWAQEKPDSAAFIFRDKNQQRSVLTWASLYRLSGRFAAVLRGKGIARGDLVINTLPNSPERVVCEAGTWMAGAVPVNDQCIMTDGSGVLDLISVSRAPAILVDPDVTDSPWNVLKNHVVMDDGEHVTSSELPCLKMVIFVSRVENEGKGDFIGQLKSQEEWFQAEDITSEDILGVFRTSGTMGFFKLVIQLQGPNIEVLQNGKFNVKLAYSEKIQLNFAQMGWETGSIFYSIVVGASRVCCDVRAGNPDDMAQFLWASIQEEKCNSAIFSPLFLPQLAEIAIKETRKRHTDTMTSAWKMDALLLGGLPVTQSMVEAGLTVAHNACIVYGLTDSGYITGMVVTDGKAYTDYDTGLDFPDVEVKIVSMQDESKPCAAGQTGHILVKSPNMMKGYLNNPKATADAFTADGFFRTGDLGRLDERGHLIVDGRGSDAIMRDAHIFNPSLTEKCLRDCPGVTDVVVVGVPDPIMNEELCACVVLESEDVSMEQVREFAEEVFVSKDDPLSACPRYYLKFEAFPRTHFGKIQRKIIKTQAAQRLGLVSQAD